MRRKHATLVKALSLPGHYDGIAPMEKDLFRFVHCAVPDDAALSFNISRKAKQLETKEYD